MYAFAAEPCPYDDLRPGDRAAARRVRPERLLLGSDFPWIREAPGYGETLARRRLAARRARRGGPREVRGGNALELFW